METQGRITLSLWSWRESNPRPNEEAIRFLHAYLRLNFEYKQDRSHQLIPYPLNFRKRHEADL